MRITKRVFQENKVRQIFWKVNISYPLIRTRTRVYQGGKKCSFFGKFDGLCFLERPVSRFALLLFYRRFLIDKIRFQILFLEETWTCLAFAFFGLLTFENCFSNKILCSWLNILRNSTTFSYLFANKSIEFRINRFYKLGRFSFIMKFMVIFVRKYDQIFQWFEHFIFFIFLFAIFRSSLNNIFTFSLLYLVLQVTLKEVNRYISLTQNFQG